MSDFLGEMSQYWAAFFIGLLTLGGFGALFVWALVSGQFRNIERPKHRILEIDENTEVNTDGRNG